MRAAHRVAIEDVVQVKVAVLLHPRAKRDRSRSRAVAERREHPFGDFVLVCA